MLQNVLRNNFLRIGLVSLTICFIAALQFYKLGDLPIVQWDESRLAINAAEMYQSGDFLVTSFKQTPDHYNTKPPLMIWLQVFSAYLFGMNEFALRFPSALAGLLCILLCGYMVFKKTENAYMGCFAALLLAASNGFIQLHGSITGDFDALLSLFVLLSIYYYQRYLFKRKTNAIYYFMVYLSLAILSKSAAACIVIPALLAACIYCGRYKKLLPGLLAMGIAFIPFIIYVSMREMADSGYIQAMLQNDFIGRVSKPLEGHTSTWSYYIVNLFSFRFNYFIWLLVPALVVNFMGKSRTAIFYSVVFLVYFVFLTVAQTRIHWYDMPLLPLISIVISLAVFHVYKKIQVPAYQIFFIVFFAAQLFFPIENKSQFIFQREGIQLDFSHYELSDMLRHKNDDKQALYIAAPYDPEFYFYSLTDPSIKREEFKNIRDNDIIYHGNLYRDSMLQTFNFTTLDSNNNAWKIHINGRK